MNKVSKIYSVSRSGYQGEIIEIQSVVTTGLPATIIVGLPDTTVEESRERVKAAIKTSGFDYPMGKVSINLAPANVNKNGSGLDLPIALAILSASGYFKNDFKNILIIGELSLDGQITEVNSALDFALTAKRNNITNIICPKNNLEEITLVDGINYYAPENLTELLEKIQTNSIPWTQTVLTSAQEDLIVSDLDFTDIAGQNLAKRALCIAAAGGHNILLSGPPGSGKTMLAKAIVSILPPLNHAEKLEVTNIYGLHGLNKGKIIHQRPFRSPHASSSTISLLGGGADVKPGEVTLAHQGVLFLDELPEFQRSTIESLRQPLEDREITISRAKKSSTYPCSFMLIATQNPCPCGFLGDTQKQCTCSQTQIQKYQAKLSGPLLDRIDIKIKVPRINFEELKSKPTQNSSDIRKIILKARDIQSKRYKKIKTNAEMSNRDVKKYCQYDENCEILLQKATEKWHLSTRSIIRVLKISRTIADLDNATIIESKHISEALAYIQF